MGSLFLEGVILQASLIFALGSQNIFVLESGLKRQHSLTVSFVCFVCDLTLILLGVAGAATLFNQFPHLKILVGVAGVGFLFFYGLEKFLGGIQVQRLESDNQKTTLKKSILLSFTFSVLNPHAYLDAFILIGGFSSKYDSLSDRIILGLGAGIYSGVWFLLLSTMSSFMRPLLENPRRMRAFMSLAGLGLMYMAGKLSSEVVGWAYPDFKMVWALDNFANYPLPPGTLFTSILY